MLLRAQASPSEKQASVTPKDTLTGPRPSLELSGPLKDAQTKAMAFILTHSKGLLCPGTAMLTREQSTLAPKRHLGAAVVKEGDARQHTGGVLRPLTLPGGGSIPSLFGAHALGPGDALWEMAP